jgi:glycerophosphoryl diester phosphodiesterase
MAIMRPIVEEQLKGRVLPLIMAHKGGTAYGRENSLQAIRRSIEIMPDIIVEVDVRKSRDGVLYCHHGSEPFGIIAASFFSLLSFAQIQKLVGQRDTLQCIIDSPPPPRRGYRGG